MKFSVLDPRLALGLMRKSVRQTGQSLTKGLNRSDEERRAQVIAMRTVVSDEELERIHTWIHTNLIILDSKAQSILSLYSFAIATLAIFYTTLGNSPKFVYIIVLIGFVIIAWSIIPLAKIAFVYWSTTEDFSHPEVMLADLLRVRDVRTRTVRIAILKGVLSLLVFAFVLVWGLVQHL